VGWHLRAHNITLEWLSYQGRLGVGTSCCSAAAAAAAYLAPAINSAAREAMCSAGTVLPCTAVYCRIHAECFQARLLLAY